MKRTRAVLPLFVTLLGIAVIILLFLQGVITGPLQSFTLPIQKWVFTTFSQVPMVNSQTEEQVREENNALRQQLAKVKELERDNKALHNQFQTTNPAPRNLLPATVVGTNEDTIIIDKGESDGVQVGDVVVVKDNVVGRISKLSPHISMITLISHPTTSFTAETAKTSAIGVVKAQGGDSITLENVVLSDSLEKDDLIVTRGDINEKGQGFPPDLVVGKIISVNKQASSLFQNAQVKSLVDFKRIRMVFVVVQ